MEGGQRSAPSSGFLWPVVGADYPRQCYGPGCTEAAREGSKYCSDDCGLKLATKYAIAETTIFLAITIITVSLFLCHIS